MTAAAQVRRDRGAVDGGRFRPGLGGRQRREVGGDGCWLVEQDFEQAELEGEWEGRPEALGNGAAGAIRAAVAAVPDTMA